MVAARRATVRDMRRSNRAAVLYRIFLDGPISRNDVAQSTALSQASVSNLVTDMIEEGLVEEAGQVDSDGGRPRVLLRVAPSYGSVIGVDVGETDVRVELFDMSMRALAKIDYPVNHLERGVSADEPRGPGPRLYSLDPATVVRDVLAGIAAVCAESDVPVEQVLGVGVALSGVVEGAEGIVHAQALGWDGVPLGAMLRAATTVPVYIDNGAKTLGQAEMWFGAGRGSRHVVVALVGSGVGAAVVADGVSYRGSRSSAGEWGHTTIVYGGRSCRCGGRGCLEAYVGAGSILDRFREANRGRAAAGSDDETALANLIASAGSSRTAARVLDETAGYLGAGFATLINLFNPERVVLGGWAGLQLGAALLPEITESARAHALHRPFAQTTIELCQLGMDAVALGAATLPVARLLDAGGVPPVPRVGSTPGRTARIPHTRSASMKA